MASASSTPTMRPDCICFDNGLATRPVPVARSKIASPPFNVSASINFAVSWPRMSDRPRWSNSAA